MRVDILTLFPDAFKGLLEHSIISRAQKKQILTLNIVNIRDFATDKHQSVDDTPFGGGAGMVMRVDVLHNALQSTIKSANPGSKPHVVLLTSSGQKYNQQLAQELSNEGWLILVCGHYEGIDERFNKYVDQEISIGDYVLTGGEIPAAVLVDSVTRLIPGVIEAESLQSESFNNSSLEYPQYTKPQVYDGEGVPEILLSGDHAKIKAWREQESLEKTKRVRPDLLSD